MRAVNAAGPGPASSARTATPKIQLPDKPTGLSAAIGDEKIALSWDDPQNSRITRWRYSKDNGATWTDVPNSGASTTTYTVPNLTNDRAYTFRVRAVTSAGAGSASDPVTATPKAVPEPPANPAAAPGGSGEIVLTWDADSTATGWQYRYKTSGGYGGWVDIPCVSPCNPRTLNTHTVTGLHNNVQYTFQVRARNSIGWGLPSELVTRPVAGAPTAPALSAAAGGDGSVTLWWTYGGGIWVDKWQYSSDGGSAWSAIAGSSRLTRSGKVTLANGVRYTFQVRGVNGKGNGAASGSRTAATLPLAPETFSATGGDRQAVLTWSRDTDDTTVTGWRYSYKSTGGYTGWINVPGGNINTTEYTVTGLSNSVTYTFQLRAVNGTGGGAPTTEVTAYTIPAAPAGLTLTPGDRKVTLSWTNPTGGATLTDTEYRYKPKASDDSDYTDWTAIDSVVTTKEVAGLDRGVRYTFQVRAVNATGDGTPSSEVAAWTYPAAPANLTAAPGDRLVSLTWDDPSNSSITRYEYQQTTSGSCGGSWTSMTDSNADTTQFVKSGLTNGTDYTFCVRAYSAGAGATSAKATAQPQPLPAMPASADATATDASSATVTWSYATLSLIEKFQGPLPRRGRGVGFVGGRRQDHHSAGLHREHRSDARHRLHLRGAGREQPVEGRPRRPGPGRHRARQAHGPLGRARLPAGHADVGRRQLPLHHALGVQQGQRHDVDERAGQQRDDDLLHRHGPRQRHGLRLQGARRQRGGERRGLGRGQLDAASQADGAQRHHPDGDLPAGNAVVLHADRRLEAARRRPPSTATSTGRRGPWAA